MTRPSTRSKLFGSLLLSLSLALAAPACGGGQRADDRAGTSASVPHTSYDRAVAGMVRVNHALEERQADLSFAIREGASAEVIADLRREVAALERRYGDAIAAMTRALRCRSFYCAEAASPGRG